jgi:hypothetical protein
VGHVAGLPALCVETCGGLVEYSPAHGEVNRLLTIIPGEFDAIEERSFPVLEYGLVVIVQGIEELGVCFALVLNSKAVNH